jgi:N-sulfoglucosamine sulfohydrolase
MINQALKIGLVSELLSMSLFGAAAAPEPVAKESRPNILFCIFDDASFEHFKSNGCKWINTPGFDKVAKEGIRFQNFYTTNAKSAPSRSSILTGLYPWQLKEAANHIGQFPSEFKVFPEALKDNGYKIGYTGKPWGPGIAKTADGKERPLTGTPYQKRTTSPPTTGISNADYAGNFSDFLAETPVGNPWFFWCGGWEPHRKYEFRSGTTKGGKRTAMIDRVPSYLPDNDSVRNDLLDYAYELEYFDNCILKLISELEKRGILDNTLIVITSDNGMPFPRSKGCSFEISNHMPMAVMWKKGIKNPGSIVSNYFSTVDLTSTFLDVAGIKSEKSGMVAPSGKSFAPIFQDISKGNNPASKGVLLFGRERNDYGRPNNQGYPTRSIMKDDFLYIANLKSDRYPGGNPETGYLDCDGSPSKTVILNQRRSGMDDSFWKQSFGLRSNEELYDISKDKDCMNNLSKDPLYTKKRDELKRLLFDTLKRQNDPRMTGAGDSFDKYPFMLPDYWNFWERVKSGEITDPASKTGWVEPSDYEKAIQ